MEQQAYLCTINLARYDPPLDHCPRTSYRRRRRSPETEAIYPPPSNPRIRRKLTSISHHPWTTSCQYQRQKRTATSYHTHPIWKISRLNKFGTHTVTDVEPLPHQIQPYPLWRPSCIGGLSLLLSFHRHEVPISLWCQ